MFTFEQLLNTFTTFVATSLISTSPEPLKVSRRVNSYPNCTIKWNGELPNWFPIVFNATTTEIVYPRRTANNSDWSIVVRRNKDLNLGCSFDAKNYVKGYADGNDIKIRCKSTGLQVCVCIHFLKN